jgi:hypothetical protein
MMGLLANIFGTGDVIKAGFDLIDDMHTSDVEIIEANADAKVRRLEAYAPFKLAQRLLAMMFAITFLFCFMMVLTCTMFGWGNPDDVREVMGEFYIAPIMFTIVGFYFGGGMLEGVLKAKNG